MVADVGGPAQVARERRRAMSEAPSLEEAVAVLAAVEIYGKKMYPRKKRLARDLPRLLDELKAATERLRAVTHDDRQER